MAHKETRSLMNMGGSLVISLPWSWLNYHEMKAGDRVEVITRGTTAEIRLLKDNGDDCDSN